MGRQRASALWVALGALLPASVSAQMREEDDAPARHLSSGSMAADPGGPTMSAAGIVLPTLPPGQSQQVSRCSAQFVQAAVAGFLSESELQPGELDCIVDGSGTIGGGVGGLAGKVGVVLGQSLGTSMPGVPGAGFCGSASSGGGGSPASIDDKVQQISARSGAAISRMFASLGAGSAAPAGGGGSVPAAAAASTAAAPPTAATTAAQSQGGAGDPSLGLFYSAGRRLQHLPGIQVQSPAGGSQASAGGIGTIPFVMQVGFSLQTIVNEWKELVGECVQPDTKAQFEIAGNHMMNLQYLTGHVLANGAEIAADLADSTLAHDHENVTLFGYDFGRALRKVLLGNSTTGQMLGGMPGLDELGNVTSGLMRGFWGPGMSMDIDLKKAPNHPVHIDMHSCVKENSAFFQQVWASTTYMFAQKTLDMQSMVEFGTNAAVTMMKLPSTLSRCNITSEQKEALMDAMQAMGHGISPDVTLPSTPVTKKQLTHDFGQMLKDWSQQNWFDFGHGLGVFLQEYAVKGYPQKYSVDGAGTLHRQLLRHLSSGSFALFLMPAALLLSMGLVAARYRGSIGWDLRAARGHFATVGPAVAAQDLEAVQSLCEGRLPPAEE